MFKILLVSVTALVACHGGAISKELVEDRETRNFNLYYYFDKANPTIAVPITNLEPAKLLTETNFNPAWKTVIIVHGHSGTGFNTINPLVRESIFANGEDINVIVMDWSIFANQAYANAVATVPQVGTNLADFINAVLVPTSATFELSKVHLIGFGLGAHVVGVAARRLNREVGRITGLDPSGNLWAANTERLTRHDAQYVEVIHTDGLGVLANGIGEPIGHVDFFANGAAVFQPGCANNLCSHNRAYELFAASVSHGNLIGNWCSTMQQVTLNTCTGSTLELGTLEMVKHGSGIYRVNTGRIYPF